MFFIAFPCVEGKQIFINWGLDLNESEINKLLEHDMKPCDDMVMALVHTMDLPEGV